MTNPKGRSKQNGAKGELPKANFFIHDELAKAYEHSPIGVIAVDAKGMINYANSMAVAYSGLKKNKLLGQLLFSVYEDITAGKLNEARLARSEEFADEEFRVKTKAGERWLLMSSRVQYDTESPIQTYLFIRDISKLKKRENLFSYLNAAAVALATTRDTPGTLEQIAQFIVPKFADWFTIDRLKDDRFELLLLKHEDPAKMEWAYAYRKAYPNDPNGNSGPAMVLKTGKPGFVPVVTEEMIDVIVKDPTQREEVRKIGMQSVMIVPMTAQNKITGLVNFISSRADRHFDEADLEFAQNFANIIGLALMNAQLNEAAAAEIALRKQSEEKFRFLTDAIPHKMWTSGPDGRATYYNQQWHDYTGIDGFTDLREKIWDFIHPDDRAVAAVEWPKAVESGEAMEMEHRLKRYDGAYRWHLSRFTSYKNEEGKAVLWVGTSTDIHEQKILELELATANEELIAANEELVTMNEEISAANEELAAMNEEAATANEELAENQRNLNRLNADLAKSEKLFRSIALSIPQSLIIVIDKDHRFMTIEGDVMEKMGYDRRNYEGKHPLEIGPPGRYEASRHLYERVMAGEKFSVERKAENGDNYMVHFIPLRNDDDEVDAGLIIALDITDFKRAEERSAKLAAIVDSSDDAIVSKTFESVITSWNAAAERMFGYTADEMIGQTIYKIIPGDRQDEEPAIIERLKKGERVEHFETKRLTREGRLLDVSLTISPVKDKQGNVIGISKIARDITEKKQEEQRKNDFIGMVSHELKTPLTSLNGIIQVASAKLKNHEDPFLSSAMVRANLQVKRMTAMINGFLNISRLEAGQMAIERQIFDMGELLREIAEETNLIVSTHTVTLAGSGLVELNADRDKISSVVSNLLSNGVKYSPKGKQIKLAYQLSGKEVTVSVADEGIGIEPQDINKVFDRYYRVETDQSRHISGFGIGLYLSAEIVKRHNGKIWAESETGKGSVFYFTLPLT